MKIIFLTRYGRLGASSRLRSFQFGDSFRKTGIVCTFQPLFSDRILEKKYLSGQYGFDSLLIAYTARVCQLMQKHRFDLIWIEKEALPWLPTWFERLLLSGVPYVLDYDDALFHNYDLHPSQLVRRWLGRRLDRLMAGARLVIGGNDYLAQRAHDAGAPWVEVVPTVVDLQRYVVKSERPKPSEVQRIVWIGSPSTIGYLTALEEPLRALAQRAAFELRVIGGMVHIRGVDVEFVRWTEDSEVESIAECDIGIMPLTDSPWERGKCGYKLIQYMACGLPVVASPIGVNRQIVRDGVNGFLADRPDAWLSHLEALLCDEALRKSMGKAGRERVEAEFSVQQVAPRLSRMLLNAGAPSTCAG